MANNMIFELEQVSFSYLGKYPALRDVSLTVKQGQMIALIGANGSGKSTLLHLLDALIFPDQGRIRAFGDLLIEKNFSDEKFAANFRRRVGLIFQNPDIQLFCPTVEEDILFGPLQLGIDRKIIRERQEKLVEQLGITGLLKRSPCQLSIGEKRKVAIVSTLMIDPDVLILDEPTAGLDPLTTCHIIDLLIRANESGKTVITSTHDLHIIEEISDLVFVFGQDKRMIRAAGAKEILDDNNFLLANNLIHMHSHRHEDKIHAHPHQHIDHQH